jgi:hypothetical protein
MKKFFTTFSVGHSSIKAALSQFFSRIHFATFIAFGCTVNLFLISFRPPHRVMKERNPINEQEAMAVETPVTIQIVASAENTYLLQSRLKDILIDASGCCEYIGYVDQNGYVRVKIECIVSGQEKQQNWDQLTKLPI